MKSVFPDKEVKPSATDLAKALKDTHHLWQELAKYTRELYPGCEEEWNFSGEKYGWSFRLKNKKRVLVYLLPRDGFFKIAFVFGQKATDEILEGDISGEIKTLLRDAKAYAEGRGIRVDVRDEDGLEDLKRLISIKIKHGR